MHWKAVIFVVFAIFSSSTEPERRGMKISGLLSKNTSGTTIFLAGDVMTGRGIDQVLAHSVDPKIYESYLKDAREYVKLAERAHGEIDQPVSAKYIWGDALDVWNRFSPAVKLINLETSITDNGEPWPGKGIHYRMHPKNINILTEAEINFVSLANNHMLDWGRSGLAETLRALKNAGVSYAGAGSNLSEAHEPAILPTSTGRIVILAYGAGSSGVPASWKATSEQSGVNYLPDLNTRMLQVIKDQIDAVKEPGDIVIFSVHWGSNWGYDIPVEQRQFAHQLIDDAGVDIVHGHSSHHPRGIEVYKDKLILYGAGDFINDYEGIGGYEEFRDDLSLMYFPVVDPATGKLISMKMVPMQIKKFCLRSASSSDSQWLQKVLNRESQKFDSQVLLNNDGTLYLKW